MRIGKAKYFKFLLLASSFVMASHTAWADNDFLAPIPLPDIEFDGSVLQQLPGQGFQENAQELPPVRLIPPRVNRPAHPPSSPLTLIAPDKVQDKTVKVEEPAPPVIQPIITTIPAPPPKVKAEIVQIVAPIPAQKPPIKATETFKDDLPPEPQIMEMADTVPAATEESGAVLFPITSCEKTRGELNPSVIPTEPAPATPDKKTASALAESMIPLKTASMGKGEWWQDNPAIILKDIPYPKKRPEKNIASEDFIREARKNLVETYTIVKREGDSMPSVPKAKITSEKLAPQRLSLADIPDDPLASQLVDMSAEDVARALNAMTPAAGREQRHLIQGLSAVAKPRIVRHEGEWIRKSRKEGNPQNSDAKLQLASLPEDAVKNLPDGPVMLSYKDGETAIPDDRIEDLKNEILAGLQNIPDMRLRIMAYAGAGDGKESTARRVSLARALALRSYFVAQGIDATRMDVRAMGLPKDGKNGSDKVDMILIPPSGE